MNKLADEVGMRFINLIQSNLIGQNYQPWYKYIIINDEYLSEVINSCPNHTDAETSYLEVYNHKFKSVTAG